MVRLRRGGVLGGYVEAITRESAVYKECVDLVLDALAGTGVVDQFMLTRRLAETRCGKDKVMYYGCAAADEAYRLVALEVVRQGLATFRAERCWDLKAVR